MAKDDLRANRAIRARECVLVDYDGKQLGNYAVSDALQRAQDEGLDLVADFVPHLRPERWLDRVDVAVQYLAYYD